MSLSRKLALGFVFAWFAIGGAAHFLATDYFVQIIPPDLPFKLAAVYVSGVFELLGALGLLHPVTRRVAGIGLFLLTIAVTPANVYMWRHPELFPRIPEWLLAARLVLQVLLLAIIGWATQLRGGAATDDRRVT